MSTAPRLSTPLPSRQTIRSWLQDFRRRSTPRALALSAFDYALFVALTVAIAVVPSVLVKLLLTPVAGFVIGRLFVLGHDACHQAFTPNKRLNAVLGRLLFLPSLTPYSLWETGHNVVHHGYTNLKGFDFVWAPLTPAEYRALPRWRQRLERIYRSGWAPGLYYLIEVWWLRMMFPSARYLKVRRPVFLKDDLLVTAFAALWVAALIGTAVATAQSAALLVLCGFVLPFLFWNTLMGFVVYAHHTHPRIRWYADKAQWSAATPFVSTTVHLQLPAGFNRLLHNILEHTAHHVDMGIPLYGLPDAQRCLEAALPGKIVVQDFSWRWYFATARHCQLYDLEAARWRRFDGKPAPARTDTTGATSTAR
ncbi:fatty acid desaturase [Solimonas marina]|uniref:Fatty acid desaturase n=1 Tax=Solimonas marina TaxID=2714601 RepID=A0A969WFP9_9GAMM|nr:fatty acid desaturase [Solimonas marina]NKF24466.1 fatty acid desaturase [Solimonas marina]